MSSNGQFSERAKARKWARNNPLRGPVRRALFEIFTELIDEDRTIYASVRWLAWRIGTNTTSVVAHLREFRDRGLITFIDRKGRGGVNRYRFDYELSLELYPDTVTLAQFKVLNPVAHFADPEVFNGAAHFDDHDASHDAPKCATSQVEVFNSTDPKCATSPAEVFNFSPRSVQGDYTKGFEVNHQGLKPEGERVGAREPRALTAPAVPTRARDVHPQQQRVLQRAAKKQATVDELVATFRELCDEGLCTWTANHVECKTMCEKFEILVRLRGATVDTVREAYSVAKASLAKNRRPSGAAITRAMFVITHELPTGQPAAAGDKPDFFDRPVPAAGTYTLPGNDTRH